MENCLSFFPTFERVLRAIPGSLLMLSLAACVNVSTEVSRDSVVPVASVSPSPSLYPPTLSAPTSSAANETYPAKPAIKKPSKPKPAASAAHPTLAVNPPQESSTTPASNVVINGNAAYFIPAQMVEKRPSGVDLWIDPSSSMEQLKNDFATRFNISPDNIKVTAVQGDSERYDAAEAGKLISMEIPIGARMVAQLRGGEGFHIDPKEPVSRDVVGADRVKWHWDVQPKQASTSKIPLHLEISISSGGGKPWNNIYDAEVLVEATPQSWYEKLYEIAQKLNAWLALLGIGGIGGVYALLSRKKVA